MKSSKLTWAIVITFIVMLGFATGACKVKLNCSGAGNLDDARAERFIARWLAGQYGITATVACPEDRPVKAGDAFTCEATAEDGEVLVLDVTQNDDQGNVTLEPRGLLVDTKTRLDAIVAKLPASTTIACPKRVLYLKQVGDTASCDVRRGDAHARLEIRYTDAEAGGFAWKVTEATD